MTEYATMAWVPDPEQLRKLMADDLDTVVERRLRASLLKEGVDESTIRFTEWEPHELPETVDKNGNVIPPRPGFAKHGIGEKR